MLYRMRYALIACTLLAMGALTLALVRDAGAQQQMPELPQPVKEWMERDQFQRWAELVRTGQRLFTEGTCVRCHGDGGKGTNRAPDLTDAVWVQSDGDLQGIFETVFWGVRRKDLADANRPFEMNPAGGQQLEWDEIRAVAAYVWTLSNGDFLPRR